MSGPSSGSPSVLLVLGGRWRSPHEHRTPLFRPSERNLAGAVTWPHYPCNWRDWHAFTPFRQSHEVAQAVLRAKKISRSPVRPSVQTTYADPDLSIARPR